MSVNITALNEPQSQHFICLVVYLHVVFLFNFSANLNSCLEEIRSILGESVPEHVMVDTVIKHNFTLEAALNDLLAQQGEL